MARCKRAEEMHDGDKVARGRFGLPLCKKCGKPLGLQSIMSVNVDSHPCYFYNKLVKREVTRVSRKVVGQCGFCGFHNDYTEDRP